MPADIDGTTTIVKEGKAEIRGEGHVFYNPVSSKHVKFNSNFI